MVALFFVGLSAVVLRTRRYLAALQDGVSFDMKRDPLGGRAPNIRHCLPGFLECRPAFELTPAPRTIEMSLSRFCPSCANAE